MIDNNILASAAAAFAALDLTAENDRLSELQVEVGRIEKAETAARERVTEIVQELGALADPHSRSAETARTVADALLAEADPKEAANVGASREELERERETLRAAVQELRQRADATRREIKAVKEAAKSEAAILAQPLADALLADSREAAERIVVAHAALHAVAHVTGGSANTGARLTRGAVQEIVSGRLLNSIVEHLEVPPPVRAALTKLDGKGAALRVQVPSAAAHPPQVIL